MLVELEGLDDFQNDDNVTLPSLSGQATTDAEQRQPDHPRPNFLRR